MRKLEARANIEGNIYGRITVLCLSGVIKHQVHWWCLCSCGELVVLSGARLRGGCTQSCGCLTKERARVANTKNPEHVNFTHLYNTYRNGAKRRKHEFSLTREECQLLFKSNCFYCGVLPKNNYAVPRNNKNPGYIYNGIDRKDNSVGYTTANSVPCCKMCNVAKHTNSMEDFEQWLERIVQFRTEGKKT
jgi:hypothetical protein